MKARIIELEKRVKEKDREIKALKAQVLEKQEIPCVLEEMKSEEGPLGRIREHI
jgi:uncharacterized coiled-coil protein SlyX